MCDVELKFTGVRDTEKRFGQDVGWVDGGWYVCDTNYLLFVCLLEVMRSYVYLYSFLLFAAVRRYFDGRCVVDTEWNRLACFVSEDVSKHAVYPEHLLERVRSS